MNSEQLRPFFNLMVVECVEKKEAYITDEQKFNLYGKVLAVGPDVQQVKEGDYIGFSQWGLTHLDINGKRHFFVPETKGIGLVGIPAGWIE